jgi:hypothetical protein
MELRDLWIGQIQMVKQIVNGNIESMSLLELTQRMELHGKKQFT